MYDAVGFVMLPSSLNKTVEQEVAVFHCQHNSCDGITWRVNGTSTTSVIQVIYLGDRSVRSSLSIATLPGFNTIECVAVFTDGSPPQFTPLVTLLIQGTCTFVIQLSESLILPYSFNHLRHTWKNQ